MHYHYGPEVFRQAPAAALRDLEVLYVVGGLYGNESALLEILRLFDAEQGRKRLVFNGDFHWFDADPARQVTDPETEAKWDRLIAAYERGLAAARREF